MNGKEFFEDMRAIMIVLILITSVKQGDVKKF